MSNLLILFAQTRTEATIEILLLLVVAGAIGFITAWLYQKSAYLQEIRNVKSENTKLMDELKISNIEKTKLYKSHNENIDTLKHLDLEVKALRALHAEAVHETDDITLKNKNTEGKLYEKEEELKKIAERKHLLDYKSFGIASKLEKDDLKMISGIGPFIEERLHALDIYTFLQISKFTASDIDSINSAIEYFSGRIERDEWVAQARELVHEKDKKTELFNRISERKSKILYNRIGVAKKEEADDLTVISGIGGWIKEKLNALDIYTFRQISNFTKEDEQTVTDAIEYFHGRIERDEWILQAKELVRIAGKKTELMNRIRERKDRIYFDRLGIAHKHQANNLTLIKGITLWIEERLNVLGIYTFEQISKLTHQDVESITEILEITPGSINREHWVNQARDLVEKQHRK